MNISKGLLLCSQLVLYVLIAACVPVPRQSPDMERLYQASTLSALSAGDFDGTVTTEMLLARGNFGLGTFDALDGEMVVLDGVVYQVRDDGVAQVVDSASRLQTPFAAVTFFSPEQSIVLSGTVDCPQLQAQIDSHLPALDKPYAIKVSGEFSYLKVRAPHKQSTPYPTLTDALADQVLFESQNISGTMVGFRLPEYMAGANSAGYHFHFISDDKLSGGHVLECQADQLSVQSDDILRIEIDVTPEYATSPQEDISYGLLLPFSGEYEWIGNGAFYASAMVESDIDRSGGINGATLQFVRGDTQGDSVMGAAAAQKLIDSGAIALIGPTSLSFAGVMPLISEYQIPMISPSAGTVALDQAGSDYFYRTVPSDSLGGRALAHAVTNSDEFLGETFENVVLLMTQEPAFLSFQEPIESGFGNADQQLAGTVAIQQGATTYAESVTEALSYSPDLIILIADPADSLLVMQEANAAGYEGRWFFTQDQSTADFINSATPSLVEGSYGLLEIAAPYSESQLSEFERRYTAFSPDPQPPFASNTYDAVTTLALATLRASIHDWTITRETVNANIPLVANPGEGKVVVTNYLEGKEVLIAGGEVNYHGVTGPIDFDEYGNILQPYGIFQVQDGAWVQLSSVGTDNLQALLSSQ